MKRIKANGTINLSDFDAVYEDSTFVNSKKMSIDIALPSTHTTNEFKELLDLGIKRDKLNLIMTDFFKADLGNANLRLGLSDVMDTTQDVALACDFDIKNVN